MSDSIGPRSLRLPWAGLLLCLTQVAVADTRLDDYAFAATLRGDGPALQQIDLGSDILTGLAHADGADIAVFNADGKRLPQRLARQPARIEPRQVELTLHRFENFVANGERHETRRQIEHGDNGLSELTIAETVAVKATEHRFLVDLQVDGKSRRFDRLELEWRQRPTAQLIELQLEVGNDLGAMQRLEKPAVITDAAGGDAGWRSIATIDGRFRYLSLKPAGEIEYFELQRVLGHYTERRAAARVRLMVSPEIIEHDGQRYHVVDLPRAVRPLALRIVPAERNQMLVAELHGSRDDQPLRLLRNRVRQHNFEQARIATAPPVTLPPGDYDRLWFHFADAPERPPTVELLFEPWRLDFLGDGRQPYTLAWGNHQANPRDDTLAGLLEQQADRQLEQIGIATIGPIRMAGGDARLTPDSPLPWKKWLLWALLIVAALLTTRMALSLYREMNPRPDPPSESS